MRILTRLLLWTPALTVAVVAGGIMALVSIDPDSYKGWMASKFHERTGRTLSLDGDVAVTLYPWLGLEVNEAGIGNAPGFGDAPFLRVDYAKVRVKLLPLLRSRYEVDTVQVRGAVVNLARDEQGVSNWADLVGGDASKTEDAPGTGDAPEAGAPALPLPAISLSGVAVEDARITWDDRQTAVRYDVSDLDVSTAALEYGEPIDLVLSFHGTSNQPAIDAAVNMKGVVAYDPDKRHFGISPLEASALIGSGNVPGGETTATLSAGVGIDLNAGTVSVSDLGIDALGTSIEGRLDASRIGSPSPSISTTVNVKGSDLALLFKVAEVEPLASRLAGLQDRSFQAGAAVDADLEHGSVSLSGLSAALLGATVTGEVEVRDVLSGTPGYQGRLDARGPDLPALMQVAGQLQGGGDSALAKYGRKLSDGSVKAFDVKADFDADWNKGNVSIPALSIDALGFNASGALDAKDMRTGKGTVSGSLEIRGADMSGLLMAFDRPGLARTLQSLELETRMQGTRSGIALAPLALEAVFAGEGIPDSPAKVVLDVADATFDPDKEALILNQLALHGPGLELAGSVNVDNALSTPVFSAFSGRLGVRTFNLRELAGRLDMKLPATAGAKTLTGVALSGRFDGSATGLNVSDLALRVDDSALTGEFRAAGTLENPAVQFDLNVDEIDLGRYTPSGSTEPPAKQDARRAGKDGGTEGGQAAVAGFIGVPVDAIRGLNVDGTLNAGKLIVSNAALENVSLHLSAKAGVVKISDVSAELYQGRLSGNAALDVNPAIPALTVDSSLRGIHVEPLLRDFAGRARVRGTGDVDAALSAAGGSIEAMKRSLNGRMSVNLGDGAIVGMNVGEHLQQWQHAGKSKSVAFEHTEATEFSTLTGNLVAKDGIVRLDDLKTDALLFHLTGKGVLADLHADTIDYEMLATVANVTGGVGGEILSELLGIELPIHVRGSLAHPKAKLEWGEALGSLLVPPILDLVPLPIPLLNEPEDGKPGSNSLGNLLEEGLQGIFGE